MQCADWCFPSKICNIFFENIYLQIGSLLISICAQVIHFSYPSHDDYLAQYQHTHRQIDFDRANRKQSRNHLSKYLCGSIHICASSEQLADDFVMTFFGGEMEGVEAVRVTSVDVSAGAQQFKHFLEISSTSCTQKGCTSFLYLNY